MSKATKILPTMVSSENGRKGMVAAMELLSNGGTALDAVELACRIVEDDPEDQSVGFGGLPNILGEVELDASIMDGRTLETGAVAAVREYGNVISLARSVMQELPHVLIVDSGAHRFAEEMGLQKQNQLTPESSSRWRERYAENGLDAAEFTSDSAPDDLRSVANLLTAPIDLEDKPLWPDAQTDEAIETASKDDTLGTVNFLARDQHGNIASAVSTSGIAWKYPGRVGDSPLIGAGNYCDNRYGAAACTGMGELAIRASTARSLILYIKMGMTIQEAGIEALRDIDEMKAAPGRYMNIVALSATGEPAGFSSVPGKKYLYMVADMEAPLLTDRTCIPAI